MAFELKKWESVLREHIDPIEYFNSFLKPLKSEIKEMSESRVAVICPFHEDTDPSFHYWKNKGIYHCFGCGFTGGVLTAHRAYLSATGKKRVSFEDALKAILSIYNLNHLYEEQDKTSVNIFEQKKEELKLDSHIYNKNEFSVGFYRQQHNRIRYAKNWSAEDKLQAYHELDVMLCAKMLGG